MAACNLITETIFLKSHFNIILTSTPKISQAFASVQLKPKLFNAFSVFRIKEIPCGFYTRSVGDQSAMTSFYFGFTLRQ